MEEDGAGDVAGFGLNEIDPVVLPFLDDRWTAISSHELDEFRGGVAVTHDEGIGVELQELLGEDLESLWIVDLDLRSSHLSRWRGGGTGSDEVGAEGPPDLGALEQNGKILCPLSSFQGESGILRAVDLLFGVPNEVDVSGGNWGYDQASEYQRDRECFCNHGPIVQRRRRPAGVKAGRSNSKRNWRI